MGDRLVRAVSQERAVAVRVVVASELVREAAARHATVPTASAALGRALMGALLLAAGSKDGETTQIQLRGRGPLRSVTAIATPDGDVRGYVKHPDLQGEMGLDVGAAIGRGLLSVVRFRPGWREPYSGYVPLVSGQVAEDLAHYLKESEQTRSAIALGVELDGAGEIVSAGGYLVQAMPEGPEEILDELSDRIEALETPTQMLAQGLDAEGILEHVLGESATVARHAMPVRFACDCSSERIERAVSLLGAQDLEELAADGKPLEITCHFCGEHYQLAPEVVRQRLEARKS